MVFQYIQEFLQLMNSNPDFPPVGKIFRFVYNFCEQIFLTGLGYFSEQAFESMHHDVKVS